MESKHFPLIAPGEILDVEGINHADIVVYAVLYGLMRLKGYCWANNGYLATRLHISERTLQRHLRRLQDMSLIRIESINSERKIYMVESDLMRSEGMTDMSPMTNLTPATTNLSSDDDSSIFLIKKDNKQTKVSFEEQILEAYKNYPLKKGKTIGVKKLAKQIKSEEDLSQLILAIKNYATECKGKEPQYIKHFSTFASCWQDYVTVEKKKSDWEVVNLMDNDE
jgi:DNA-binding Lrp family transcriptional regulator